MMVIIIICKDYNYDSLYYPGEENEGLGKSNGQFW